MANGIADADYIRWVKGSLNRLLGTALLDNGSDNSEYRFWIREFQTNQGLTADGKVNEATQNALMKLARYLPNYVVWVQRALNRSSEGDGRLPVSGYWNTDTEDTVKDFQINEELTVDGYIGAKTETALWKRTRIPIPGRLNVPRPRGVKPKPAPTGWSDSLTPELRALVWFNGMHIDITTNPGIVPDPDQRRQMLCMLSKLKSQTGSYDFAYLTRDRIQSYIAGDSALRGVDADDISNDARKEILRYVANPLQHMSSYAEAWDGFQRYVWQTFYAITKGLNKVKELVNDDVWHFDQSVKNMRWWVLNRQEKDWSVLKCFK